MVYFLSNIISETDYVWLVWSVLYSRCGRWVVYTDPALGVSVCDAIAKGMKRQ